MVDEEDSRGTSPDLSTLFPDRRREGETTLRQCQLVMIRMLGILDHLCRKNGITYWLTSGTLIGALRHKAMIPWDCDIDVAMPEESYLAFCDIAWQLPPDIFFQNPTTDPAFTPTIMGKLRDRYSSYYEWAADNPDCRWHHGLQVDLVIYKRDAQDRLVNPFRGTAYDMDDIFPLQEVEFENMQLMAPRRAASYLFRRYGDFRKFPPPEARIPGEGKADPFSPCSHPESRPYPHPVA